MVSPIRSESNQHGESGHAYQSAEVFSVTRTLSPSRISRSPASFRDHPSRFRKVSVSHSRTTIYKKKKSTHLTRKIIQRLCPLHDLFLLSLLRFWFWLRLWHGCSRDTAHGRRRKGFLRRKRRWRVHRCRRCALRGRRSAQRAEHSPSGRYVHISEFLPHPPYRTAASVHQSSNGATNRYHKAHLLRNEAARSLWLFMRWWIGSPRWRRRECLCGCSDTAEIYGRW